VAVTQLFVETLDTEDTFFRQKASLKSAHAKPRQPQTSLADKRGQVLKNKKKTATFARFGVIFFGTLRKTL